MKHDPKTKHQHYCHTCNNTGFCQSCQGRGCMDCNYTGLCRRCQDISTEDERQKKPVVRAR